MENNIVEKVIKASGGTPALAKALGIKVQAIYQWKKIPPLRVLAVEKASGIPRHRLRPDLYPRKDAIRAARE